MEKRKSLDSSGLNEYKDSSEESQTNGGVVYTDGKMPPRPKPVARSKEGESVRHFRGIDDSDS